MIVQKVDIIDIPIDTGSVHRMFVGNIISEGDAKGNIYGFRCVRDGEIVDLTGCSCYGYFVRADGATVVINGSVSLNRGYVVLPPSCYAVPGPFTLAIRLNNSDTAITVRIVDGVVTDTTTNTIVDPGHVVPSVDDLLTLIDQAEAAAAIIESFSVTAVLKSGDDYRIVVTTQ